MGDDVADMVDFASEVGRATGNGRLLARALDTIQVNIGLRCNLECAHCHVASSPKRREMMTWETMEAVVRAAERVDCGLVDVTGGAPELNPHFRRFVSALRARGRRVQVRTNLTVLLEPPMDGTMEFLRHFGVELVASLPCYRRENVDAQRGEAVYERSIEALRRLNRLGYGMGPGLPLSLVYNPSGPFLPPDEAALEADYRRELEAAWGVSFTRLVTLANMPIGRFRSQLRREGGEAAYLRVLRRAFNPSTVAHLMCRHQVSVGWDGTLYDCDFNLALGRPVAGDVPRHVARFDPSLLVGREIVTGDHCFGCTAGAGSSCAGALVKEIAE